MVRFAVIGTNFVTDRLLDAAKQVDGFHLVGVYSRTQARADEYAVLHGAKKRYTDLGALCADGEIDAVYVASPNLCHERQAIALLCAGKHVLCEKPIAPDEAALHRMMAAARQSGRVLMEAMIPAHAPGWATIRAQLPRLGAIRRATLMFCQYSSRYDRFKRGVVENAFDPRLKNGALMDLGVYLIHMMQSLFGMPDEISGAAVFLPGGVDGEGAILARYSNLLCELIYSKITQGILPSQIQGEAGALLIDSVTLPRKLTVALRDGTREELDLTPPLADMAYEIADFIAGIERGENPEFAKSSANTTRLLDCARDRMDIRFERTDGCALRATYEEE